MAMTRGQPHTLPPRKQPRLICQARLLAMAAHDDHVLRTLATDTITPCSAIGVFLMRRSALRVVAFCGQREWRVAVRNMAEADEAYTSLRNTLMALSGCH